MRLLAFLLIWVSLGVGVVAATTAYMWEVPAAGDEVFQLGADAQGAKVYAVLGAPAGRVEGGIGVGAKPLFETDTALTPEVVAALREAGVGRVRVKSFKVSRWTHFPYFGGACVGLLAGAILTRLSSARDARLADQLGDEGDRLSPEKAVAELRAVVRALRADLTHLGDEAHACAQITERLGTASRDLVPAVVEQRERLVARMGLGPYAALMDVFASAERSLNRSWSAAADLSLVESVEALQRAGERLAVAEDKLTGRTPSLLPLG
jgi:hypothetical protein